MNTLQAVEVRELIAPAAIVDAAAFTTNAIDMKGVAEALFIIQFGAMDIAATAFKLQESEASNMGSATDVSGADFSVSPLTLPAGTVDNTIWLIHVSNRGNRKRYLDVSLTGGDGSAGTYAAGTVVLTKKSEQPNTAAEQGASQAAYV